MSGFSFGNSGGTGFNFGSTTDKKNDNNSGQQATDKPAFSFGSTTTQATTTSGQNKPAFSFGSTQSTTAAAQSAANTSTETKPAFSFGSTAAPTSFSFGSTSTPAPAEKKPEQKAPASGFSFGGASTTAPAASSQFGGFTTSSNQASSSKNTTQTSLSGTSLSGGFSFGTPATPAQNQSKQPQTPATVQQSPLSLSTLKTPDQKPADKTTSVATPSLSFGFGSASKTEPAKDDKKQSETVKADFKLNNSVISTDTNKQEQKVSDLNQTSQQSTQIITSLKGKNVSEILSEWQNDLHQTLNQFHTKANEISRLDSQLLEVSDVVYNLVVDSNNLTGKQNELISVLDFIEGQQNMLDKELDQFEEKLVKMVQDATGQHKQQQNVYQYPGGVQLGAEAAREKTYETAIVLNQELSSINNQINEIVNFLNQSLSGSNNSIVDGSGSAVDPISLITKILNQHYNSLQWIDSTTSQLSKKVADMKLSVDSAKSDIENVKDQSNKSFRRSKLF